MYIRLFGAFLVIHYFLKSRPHPTTLPAPLESLVIPGRSEDVLEFAHAHAHKKKLPVYVFYKARSGQLNNQLISFFNALAIAKEANATLVAPFAFYGSESRIDFGTGRGFFFHLREAFDLYIHEAFLKSLGLYYKHDELVGDYIDGELINCTQPVISITQFMRSEGGAYLRTFPHVLTRRGDAPFYYMSLGKRRLLEQNVNVRGAHSGEDSSTSLERPASRKELDCNFNISDYFRGVPYRAGVNGNFLFLAKLYRSHSLNCTSVNQYWLNLRQYVQPVPEIRQVVAEALGSWGIVLSLHLRLFPFDIGKFSTTKFCNHFLSRFHEQLQSSDHLYIAYSVSSKKSIAIISELRKKLGAEKILTAREFGNLYDRGPHFNKRYAAPLVDMWTAVNSDFFVGRLGSSLSWNVVYWRQAFGKDTHRQAHQFYQLLDFSTDGQNNPTDSYGF